MATLANMPPELLLLIADALSPKDAFRFAAIDRNTWRTCASLVATHKELAENYGFICPDGSNFTLYRLLDELLATPRVADYVLELQLDMPQIFYFDSRHIWYSAGTPSLKPALEDVDKYLTAANDMGFLFSTESERGSIHRDQEFTPEDLRRSIEDGCTDPIAIIVLSRLRALNNLRLVPCGHEFWFPRGLQGLAAACVLSTFNSISHGPFENLKKVQVSHDDTEGSIHWEWAVLFTRLPNLEYFSAHMLGGSPGPQSEEAGGLYEALERWEPAKSPTSNLKTLLLSYAMVSFEVVDMILSNCKALETFEYHVGGALISWDAEYDPRGFMHSLMKYCSHSLRRLVLENEEDCESIQDVNGVIRAIPDLRCMKKLQVLRCHYADLVVDEQSESDFTPSSIFPTTLEHLHLDTQGTHDVSQRLVLLDIMLKSKNDALPSLSQLFLDNSHDLVWNNEGYSVRKDRTNEHGMKYESIERLVEGLFMAPNSSGV